MIWGEDTAGKGNSTCKGPEVGPGLVDWRKRWGCGDHTRREEESSRRQGWRGQANPTGLWSGHLAKASAWWELVCWHGPRWLEEVGH